MALRRLNQADTTDMVTKADTTRMGRLATSPPRKPIATSPVSHLRVNMSSSCVASLELEPYPPKEEEEDGIKAATVGYAALTRVCKVVSLLFCVVVAVL